MNEKKHFNIFDWYFKGSNKDNNKLDINALEKPSVANFFKVVWKKLGKLLSTNLIFIFGNFPVFFFLLALSGILSETASAPLYHSWGPIYGASKFSESAEISSLSSVKISAAVLIKPLSTKISSTAVPIPSISIASREQKCIRFLKS